MWNGIDASLNGFWSEVDGLISPAGGDQSRVQNLEDATLRGIELAGGIAPFAWARLDLNYTYLDTDAHSAGGASALASDIQHKPAHRFNGVLRLFLPWQFGIRMEGLYTSRQLEQFGGDVFVDGFALWNVQLTREFGSWLTLFAGCDNLLDVDYEEKLGTPEPGRRAMAGLRATY